MSRPDLSRIPSYYHTYINQVEQHELIPALREQGKILVDFLQQLPAEKVDYRYAEGKWTIKEVLQHILDAERIFAYRALCMARKDSTPLPSFDENSYADNAKADKRNWKEMIEEFSLLRRTTEIFFASLDTEQLETAGTASGKSMYVRGIGFIIVGHANHHLRIFRERYL
jgi:uncharacterized damage-inducible protein DinB